jgi:hypothetical protein
VKRFVRLGVLVPAIALLGAAIVWKPFAEPLLVRFPTDVDETIRYEGTFEVQADPATLTPLATPLTLPLKIERRIHVVDSSFKSVVVREDLTMYVGDLPAETDYVSHEFDRRTMKLIDGPNSWAFERSHAVPRQGSRRINFPLNTTTGRSYGIWANETDTVTVLGGGRVADPVDGIGVIRFHGITDAPASAAYTRALVDKGFAAGVKYQYMADDTVTVEPRTGTLVTSKSVETVRARNADGTVTPIYTARFEQTPSSVAEVVDELRPQLRMLSLVQTWIPLALLAGGMVLLLIHGVLRHHERDVVVRAPRPRAVPVRA